MEVYFTGWSYAGHTKLKIRVLKDDVLEKKRCSKQMMFVPASITSIPNWHDTVND